MEAEATSSSSSSSSSFHRRSILFSLHSKYQKEKAWCFLLHLLSKLKTADKNEVVKQKKAIIDLLGGDVKLRSKRELIEKFIEENLPNISDADTITDEFEKYWQEQKVKALTKICSEENLDQAQFNSLIQSYTYNGQEPIRILSLLNFKQTWQLSFKQR